jgi:hypothetical protein
LETLHAWYKADSEMAWNVRMMMQKHGLEIDSIEETSEEASNLAEAGFTHVHQSQASIDLGVPLRDSAAGDALLAELIPSLQLGQRRGTMKRYLDDTTREEKKNDLMDTAMRYEPAVRPRVISSRLENRGTSTIPPRASTTQSGVLGYLLLKRMYESHGIFSVRTRGDDCAVELAMRAPSDANLLRATKSAIVANEVITPATDEEMVHTLHLLGRMGMTGNSSAEIKSPRWRDANFRGRAMKTYSVVAVPVGRANSPKAHPPSDSKPNRCDAKTGRRVRDKISKIPLNPAAAVAVAPYSLETLQALADGVTATYVTQPDHPTAKIGLNAKGLLDRLHHPAAARRPWSGPAADSEQIFPSSLLEELSPFVEQPLGVYLNNMREQAPTPSNAICATPAPVPSARNALKQQQGEVQEKRPKRLLPDDNVTYKGRVLRRIKIIK